MTTRLGSRDKENLPPTHNNNNNNTSNMSSPPAKSGSEQKRFARQTFSSSPILSKYLNSEDDRMPMLMEATFSSLIKATAPAMMSSSPLKHVPKQARFAQQPHSSSPSLSKYLNSEDDRMPLLTETTLSSLIKATTSTLPSSSPLKRVRKKARFVQTQPHSSSPSLSKDLNSDDNRMPMLMETSLSSLIKATTPAMISSQPVNLSGVTSSSPVKSVSKRKRFAQRTLSSSPSLKVSKLKR